MSLSPHREGALGVHLTAWDAEDEALIGFDDDDFWTKPIYTPHEVDWHLDAAVEGRVQLLRGPDRGVVLVDEGEGSKQTGWWGGTFS